MKDGITALCKKQHGKMHNSNQATNMGEGRGGGVDDLLSKLVAEIDEVFSGGGQGVSEQRDSVADMKSNSRHVGTRITHRIQVLPRNLVAHAHNASKLIKSFCMTLLLQHKICSRNKEGGKPPTKDGS